MHLLSNKKSLLYNMLL